MPWHRIGITARILLARLNNLVLRGHQQLYRPQQHIGQRLLHFINQTFPQAVRAHWKLCGLSALLFYVPMILIGFMVFWQPDLAYHFVSETELRTMAEMYDPNAEHLGRERGSDDDVLMFPYYIRNNVGIGLQTFAGGLLFGLGSLFLYVITA